MMIQALALVPAVHDKILVLLAERLDAATIAQHQRSGRSQSESKAAALACARPA